MGTEDWILNGTKLITITKKQRLKIQSIGQTLKKYNIKKITKFMIHIYEISFKNKVFFCKVIPGFKNENQSNKEGKN